MSQAGNPPRFVLTGPSGWIGQAMLAHFVGRFGTEVGRQVVAFASSSRTETVDGGHSIAVRDLATIIPEDVDGSHVIHLAYLTKEKMSELGERAFTDANLAIDDHLLNAMAQAKPASIFVASSGAASLAATGADLHPYGMAKLRQEARFLDFANASTIPVVAGRIFNLAGPYINKLEAYAISNFVIQAERMGHIFVEASVPVFRSFLHVGDLCKMIVAGGLAGIHYDRPIDLCGSEVFEMGEIADCVAAVLGRGVQVRRGEIDCRRPSIYLGDASQTKVFAMQTGQQLASFAEQVLDTVRWMSKDCEIGMTTMQAKEQAASVYPNATAGRKISTMR